MSRWIIIKFFRKSPRARRCILFIILIFGSLAISKREILGSSLYLIVNVATDHKFALKKMWVWADMSGKS